MSRRERRAMHAGGIRMAGDGAEGQFEARVCNYNVADTYGTVWLPGCFADALREKLPKVVWGHDWHEPIGRVVDYRDSDEGLDVIVQLSDFEAVPRARQCWVQLRDGDLTDFSFGFERREWTMVARDESDQYGELVATEFMQRAGLDEVSPVLVGAVPGTALLGVRDDQQVPAQMAAAVLTRLGAGEIDLHEALGEIKRVATTGDDGSGGGEQKTAEEIEAEEAAQAEAEAAAAAAQAELDAEADAALALLPH